MQRVTPAASPDDYVAALEGWQRGCVETLRAVVRRTALLEERVKWGHLVYLAGGPVLLIRAEAQRVLLGFWRGKTLRAIEPCLKPGGKYDMATIDIREGGAPSDMIVRRLVEEAVALNRTLGDPTREAKTRG